MSAEAWTKLSGGDHGNEFGDLVKHSADKKKKDDEDEKDPSVGMQRPVFSDEAPSAEQVYTAERARYLGTLGVCIREDEGRTFSTIFRLHRGSKSGIRCDLQM
jgi:hypothetical protein